MNSKILLISLTLMILSIKVFSETPGVAYFKGVVLDAENNEPLENVAVFFESEKRGTTTNEKGEFQIDVHGKISNKAQISCVGYNPKDISISDKPITVKLSKNVKELSELVVQKKRYTNKNNAAVELIRLVIDNKKQNRKEAIDYYENESYEKVQFAINNITPEFTKKKIFNKFQFVFNNIDSLQNNGDKILPVYLKEDISKFYYQKNPHKQKSLLKAHKVVNLDGFDNKGIEDNIKYLYQDIDIYDNNITFLSNQFLSPIANSAPSFYRYYVLDTIQTGVDKCVRMYFGSRNKADLLFQGYLYILLDGSYAIKKIELSVNKDINMNWVNDVKIVQEFEKTDASNWMLSTDQISINFGIKKNSRGLFGQKITSYKNYKFTTNNADSIFENSDKEPIDRVENKSAEYWDTHRHTALTSSEAGTYSTMDSIQKIPVFKTTIDIVSFLFSGYKDFGLYEIGPVSTFYMYNPVEGVRFRLGGRTTDKLSSKFNVETYLAYGLKDEQFKYYLGGTWSFTDRKINEFPVKSLKVSYQKETQLPGQQVKFLMEDNFLLSIKRGVNDQLFYNKIWNIEHLNEFENHFSYTLGYKNTVMTPGGSLSYNYTDYASHTNDVSSLKIPEFYVNLRYAPHESFYQGKTFRVPYYNRFPIFELRYNAGSKLWGNDYNYHTLRFNLRKRLYLSVLGYSDIVWETGKTWGKVPYPLLNIPQANQTYSYQIESYNMMNFLEFVSDEYTSLLIDHTFNGFFFNKIPLTKRLNIREMMTCKILYGNLSKTNDPSVQNDLFKFPVNSDGNSTTFGLGDVPYIEGSIGIGNIFKFFRIDLVRRFTYLDNPNVSKYGVRMRFRLDF